MFVTSVANLPQTFGEAIAVTNSLGFCFLLIDAICIVQDNGEDHGHKISSMDRIY